MTEQMQPLDDQRLEQIVGGAPDPKLIIRRVTPETGGHPNNGTYIPPSDPTALAHVGLNPADIPANHSYTWSADGKNIIQHIRPSY